MAVANRNDAVRRGDLSKIRILTGDPERLTVNTAKKVRKSLKERDVAACKRLKLCEKICKQKGGVDRAVGDAGVRGQSL